MGDPQQPRKPATKHQHRRTAVRRPWLRLLGLSQSIRKMTIDPQNRKM